MAVGIAAAFFALVILVLGFCLGCLFANLRVKSKRVKNDQKPSDEPAPVYAQSTKQKARSSIEEQETEVAVDCLSSKVRLYITEMFSGKFESYCCCRSNIVDNGGSGNRQISREIEEQVVGGVGSGTTSFENSDLYELDSFDTISGTESGEGGPRNVFPSTEATYENCPRYQNYPIEQSPEHIYEVYVPRDHAPPVPPSPPRHPPPRLPSRNVSLSRSSNFSRLFSFLPWIGSASPERGDAKRTPIYNPKGWEWKRKRSK